MRCSIVSSCVCMLGLLLGIGIASAEDAPARWYVMQLEGQRVGYMREQETRDDAGHIVSETDVEMTMRRGAVPITISVVGRFIETPEGQPIEAVASMNMGGSPIVTTMRFNEHAIEVLAEQGGKGSKQTLPKPQQAWLPPAALSRHVEQQLEAGAETIEVWTLDPLNGPVPFRTVMRIVGRENVEVLGKTVPAIVWDASVSILPGVVMREYVDEHGQTIKATMSLMPGLSITILEADEQLAKSPVEPAEVMAQTLITPEGARIESPRVARKMVAIVQGPDEPLPTTAVQTVSPHDEADAWSVVVDLDAPRAEPLNDDDRARYLSASVVINHEDPAVRSLRDRALATKMRREPYQDAELLRRFVYRFVEAKDLSVGFATAGDVARTAQGDCTEHGVLLAALLRAQGIPSRCVSGLVYADAFLGRRAIFGYHLWTQAYLDPDGEQGPQEPRWVDLDATLGEEQAFDATHIALRIAAMDQPSPMNDLMELAPLLGRLSIEVIDAE